MAISADSRRLRARARRFVARARQLNPNLVCAVLYGSAAQGTAGPHSDLDLLLIFEGPMKSRLLREQHRGLWAGGVDLRFYNWAMFEEVSPSSWAYYQHVRRQHIALLDHPNLADALNPPAPAGEDLADDLEQFVEKTLQIYREDPVWLNGSYVLALGVIYKCARSAAMLANARRGDFTADRRAALRALATRIPRLNADVEQIIGLEACWQAEQGGRLLGRIAVSDVCRDNTQYLQLLGAGQRIVAAAARELRQRS
jgi:hypothetical protein